MQRRIQAMVRRGELRESSTLDEVPYIGSYLYDGLHRAFASRAPEVTIRRFARAIERFDLATLKRRLQQALQNARSNHCVRRSPTLMYHVSDYNQKGYEAMVAVIKVFARQPIGGRFAFDARRLRLPPRRSESTKTMPCLSRRRCPPGRWHDGLCQPPDRARGFDGVYPHSGQSRRRGSSRLQRGRYARPASAHGRTRWRRPGPLQPV